MDKHIQEADAIQRIVAKQIAKSEAGIDLLLIGGFRYRLLDGSDRFSMDIDYHFAGDLQKKQNQLLRYCKSKVVGEVKRLLGYNGSAANRTGPDAESHNAAFVDLRFWKADVTIELPLEITRIICLDKPIMRTANGTIHPTPSNADMIEGKILAVLNRVYLQHRDLVDIFLYQDNLLPNSPARIKTKLTTLGTNPASITARLSDLNQNTIYHATAIQTVIDLQIEPAVAQQMKTNGGGRAVLEQTLSVLNPIFRE